MTRFLDDCRRLNDSTQLTLAVAAVVALGLPWRTNRDFGPNPQSGWAGLDSSAEGIGWLLIIGVAASMVGIGAAQNGHAVELHSGVVVGAVLLLGCGARRTYAAVLRKRRHADTASR